MTQRRYMDYNASMPINDAALRAVVDTMQLSGNGSSIHQEGRYLRAKIEETRSILRRGLDAPNTDIIFTASATEAANLAIRGYVRHNTPDHIYYLPTEHAAILSTLESMGKTQDAAHHGIEDAAHHGIQEKTPRIEEKTPQGIEEERRNASAINSSSLDILSNGLADQSSLKALIDQAQDQHILLVMQLANNETGVIQDLEQIISLIPDNWTILVDAVQAIGKMPVSFRDLGADMMLISGHKIGAPQGIGALVKKKSIKLSAQITGGGQESFLRAGTEATALIAGLGAALEDNQKYVKIPSKISQLRDKFEAILLENFPGTQFHGATAPRLNNTSCFSLPNIVAETALIYLDINGFALGSGSACSSGKVSTSHVLQAMQVKDEYLQSALRLSIGEKTTQEDITTLIATLKQFMQNKQDAA